MSGSVPEIITSVPGIEPAPIEADGHVRGCRAVDGFRCVCANAEISSQAGLVALRFRIGGPTDSPEQPKIR